MGPWCNTGRHTHKELLNWLGCATRRYVDLYSMYLLESRFNRNDPVLPHQHCNRLSLPFPIDINCVGVLAVAMQAALQRDADEAFVSSNEKEFIRKVQLMHICLAPWRN